jgi:hypothetical protein
MMLFIKCDQLYAIVQHGERCKFFLILLRDLHVQISVNSGNKHWVWYCAR